MKGFLSTFRIKSHNKKNTAPSTVRNSLDYLEDPEFSAKDNVAESCEGTPRMLQGKSLSVADLHGVPVTDQVVYGDPVVSVKHPDLILHPCKALNNKLPRDDPREHCPLSPDLSDLLEYWAPLMPRQRFLSPVLLLDDLVPASNDRDLPVERYKIGARFLAEPSIIENESSDHEISSLSEVQRSRSDEESEALCKSDYQSPDLLREKEWTNMDIEVKVKGKEEMVQARNLGPLLQSTKSLTMERVSVLHPLIQQRSKSHSGSISMGAADAGAIAEILLASEKVGARPAPLVRQESSVSTESEGLAEDETMSEAEIDVVPSNDVALCHLSDDEVEINRRVSALLKGDNAEISMARAARRAHQVHSKRWHLSSPRRVQFPKTDIVEHGWCSPEFAAQHWVKHFSAAGGEEKFLSSRDRLAKRQKWDYDIQSRARHILTHKAHSRYYEEGEEDLFKLNRALSGVCYADEQADDYYYLATGLVYQSPKVTDKGKIILPRGKNVPSWINDWEMLVGVLRDPREGIGANLRKGAGPREVDLQLLRDEWRRENEEHINEKRRQLKNTGRLDRLLAADKARKKPS